MSKSHVKIRYVGEALTKHSMDVHDLAPALLAIADICKIANQKFNGDKATVKVVVDADLNLQLVQSVKEKQDD